MHKSLLKEIVLEQEKDRLDIDTGIPRDALSVVSRHASLPHAVVVSGVRRCGKSTLLNQVISGLYNPVREPAAKPKASSNGVYYLNFEDERLVDFNVEDFNHLYEVFLELYGDKKVFFFDEVQNVPKWEVFVRRMQGKGCKFFITGSNASLLSRELGTKLTGRNVTVELFPFSFMEFLFFKGFHLSENSLSLTAERAAIKKHFAEYLNHGGMPEYLKYQDATILKRVYEDILYRDIVARHGIKQVKPLRELGLYLLSNIGGTFSYNNLKKILGLGSMNTIKSYADFMENSYLIFLISRFSYSLKQQFVSVKKIYCIDNGLAEAVAFQFSKNKGKFLENLVFLELRRKFPEIYYYKTTNNLEVDFLIKSGKNDLKLIQVADNLDNEKIRQRELNALIKAMDELKLKTALILTEDTEEEIALEGKVVTVKPIYKWLLGGGGLEF
ncbi:MAG: ATP-binding protein [Candidatus Omnitrophica bacterium]|nr:ATP-binding protein [Candidatus Omnitrophota bacterium]